MVGGKCIYISIQNIFVLLQEVLSVIWSRGNLNAGMNPSFIQLEFEQLFAEVARRLNGSYFVGIIRPHGIKTLE